MLTNLTPAKFERPRLSPTFVRRTALIERLNQGLDRRVTLLSAPAGFGKSILAVQWLQEETSPSGWLALDPLDNELSRFLTYLVAALRVLKPEGFPRTEEALGAPTLLGSPEVLADQLATELHGTEGVLVLDELEVLVDAAVHDFIDRLVLNGPPGVHFVFLSRVDPPFPLSRWRSRRWLRELRGHELRFDLEEVRTILDSEGLGDLDDESVELLYRKTEGWPAGLRLARLSLSGVADPADRIRKLSGTSRLVADYLVDEVVASLSREMRRFLGVACHLERISAPLCEHLLSPRETEHSSAFLLDQLYHENVFLFPYGADDGWYRFHSLFRQFLTDRAGTLAPGYSREEVLARAGDWYEEEGVLQEALRLRVVADDVDGAVELVARNFHSLLDVDPSRQELAGLLALLPESERKAKVPLRTADLFVKLPRWDMDAILEEVDAIEEILESDDGQARWSELVGADLHTLRAFASYWSGRFEDAIRSGDAAQATARPPCVFRDGLALCYRDAAVAAAPDAGRDDETSGRSWPAGRADAMDLLFCGSRALVALNRGDLEDCARWATRIGLGTQSPRDRFFAGIARYFLGAVAYERNELQAAEKHFGEVRSLRSDTMNIIANFGMLGLGATHLAAGDLAAADTFAREAEAFARESGNLQAIRDAEALTQRVGVGRGTSPESIPRPRLPDFMRFSVHLPTESWIMAELGRPSAYWIPSALKRLDELVLRAEEARMDRSVVRLTIARALVLDRAERRDEAVEAMREALARGESLRLVRSFVDFGPTARELILDGIGSEGVSTYMQNLLGAFGEAVSTPWPIAARNDRASAERPSADMGHDLTNRELSVLLLLQERMSNKEIARRLSLTAETVRKYTVTIYRKLGVGGRRQAVAAALARGVLSEEDSPTLEYTP